MVLGVQFRIGCRVFYISVINIGFCCEYGLIDTSNTLIRMFLVSSAAKPVSVVYLKCSRFHASLFTMFLYRAHTHIFSSYYYNGIIIKCHESYWFAPAFHIREVASLEYTSRAWTSRSLQFLVFLIFLVMMLWLMMSSKN